MPVARFLVPVFMKNKQFYSISDDLVFLPTSTVKCGELEVCPEGTVFLRPLLYTEPTVCVHRKFNLHENLLKSPCAEIPWFVVELVLMCPASALLVLFIMEIVKCCRGGVEKNRLAISKCRNWEISEVSIKKIFWEIFFVKLI
ncbi:hypothetical protein DdX_22341 [Ditylenchus destructor]|uniref:Uncharacterized protein n=1 Tax=Ditylenchus destructor TaxID=166010 RepID=A0AAD4MEI0_9BILA|nr:hypothetical protein DdX_22341 [Ditylenchus destructor]